MARLNLPNYTALDANGDPISGAKLNFYETATSTPLDTYSDSALSVANTNPVVADSAGRWGDIFLKSQDYKIVYTDASDVTISTWDPVGPETVADYFNDIAGGLLATGSSNAYVVTTNQTIGALAAGQRISFIANFTNTAAVTLAVDGLVAKPIKKNHDLALLAGDIEQNQIVDVIYKATEDVFQMQTPAAIQAVFGKGADVASATALTLGVDGNIFDITGTTTITSIATLGIGSVVKLHFDGALILTHHATDLILPGGSNITTAAGDEAELYEYASGDWRLTNYVRAGASAEWTYETMSTTTGGTSVAFTGIPAGVTDIEVFILGLSLSGTDEFEIQIGPSGGLETSGYVGRVDSPATFVALSSAFVLITSGIAANTYHGKANLRLVQASSNTWFCESSFVTTSGADPLNECQGYKPLAGAISLLTLNMNGANTIDANAGVQIRYR